MTTLTRKLRLKFAKLYITKLSKVTFLTEQRGHFRALFVHIIEGIAFVQERGGKHQVLKADDTMYTTPVVEYVDYWSA